MKKLLMPLLGITILASAPMTFSFDQAPDPIENAQADENSDAYSILKGGLHKYLGESAYDMDTLIAQIKSYIQQAKENPYLKNIIEKIEAMFHKVAGDPQAFINDPKGFISTHYNDDY